MAEIPLYYLNILFALETIGSSGTEGFSSARWSGEMLLRKTVWQTAIVMNAGFRTAASYGMHFIHQCVLNRHI